MIIKVISTKINDFYLQDTKELKEMTEKQFLDYLKRNKKAKLLNYMIQSI